MRGGAMRVYTVEQMRTLERRADEAGHSYDAMMERAGSAVAEAVAAWVPAEANGGNGKEKARVLVLAGPGNNGGDGLVAGRELARRGFSVAGYLWKRDADEPRAAEARQAGVSIVRAEGDKEWQTLRRALGRADIVLDALLGTGVARPIEGDLGAILEQLAEVQRPAPSGNGNLTWVQRHGLPRAARRPRIVAVDLPSGVNADSGAVDPATVPADLTVTLAGPKLGMLLAPAADTVGELVVADIGIPAAVIEQVEAAADFLDAVTAAQLLPRRPASGHKGTFGKVMIVGGSANYVGAPGLAAEGAGRSGAGLVTLAVPNLIAPTLAAKSELTSMTWLLLPHDLGALTPDALQVLRERLADYDAVAVGMGVGREEVTQRFIHGLLGLTATAERGRAPIGFVRARAGHDEAEQALALPAAVLDADALNLLAETETEWWAHLPPQRLVLTPHPGEMSRLTGRDTEDIQAHRLDVAGEQARRWGQVVVLKGAYSVIAAPDGRASFSPFATAALATAGTGDVLAGVIAGLMAQGLRAYDAARLGVYLHGLAGALMADAMPGALSSDLPGFLADAWALLIGL